MQPSFSSSHVLPLLTWMDRTHQIDIRWVSPFFLGTTVARNELGEPNKHGNSKLALCCLTCHCAWEMAGASRQWQHPHVDIFKTRSGAGSGCRAATRDFDRSGAFLIWTSLMDLNGPMFGSHINARLFPIFPNFGGGWCFYPQNPGVPHCQSLRQELWHRCFQQFALSSLLAGRRRARGCHRGPAAAWCLEFSKTQVALFGDG